MRLLHIRKFKAWAHKSSAQRSEPGLCWGTDLQKATRPFQPEGSQEQSGLHNSEMEDIQDSSQSWLSDQKKQSQEKVSVTQWSFLADLQRSQRSEGQHSLNCVQREAALRLFAWNHLGISDCEKWEYRVWWNRDWNRIIHFDHRLNNTTSTDAGGGGNEPEDKQRLMRLADTVTQQVVETQQECLRHLWRDQENAVHQPDRREGWQNIPKPAAPHPGVWRLSMPPISTYGDAIF